jgi:putative membrane protein
MKSQLNQHLIYALKGIGMGAANVIPGVSGGTVALITGVFERIINAIKSFDAVAISLLFKGRIKELLERVDFFFLLSLGIGMIISIVSLARIFKFLFASYPVFIWSFFFGLILASVYYVGKTIEKWRISVYITFAVGVAIAILISFTNPAVQNESFFYLVICGVVAVCSMILPGISGSFVLILMGNYELIMIDAVNNFSLNILIPVIIGGVVGIISLSHLLSWVFKKFKDQTIALLTGFILGSLSILWPWKNEVYRVDSLGNFILKDGVKVVQGYDIFFPQQFTSEIAIAILLAVVGVFVIVLMEKFARNTPEN